MIITLLLIVILVLNRILLERHFKFMAESLLFLYSVVVFSSLITLSLFYAWRYEENSFVVSFGIIYGLICIIISSLSFNIKAFLELQNDEKIVILKKLKFIFIYYFFFPMFGFIFYLIKVLAFIEALTSLMLSIDAFCFLIFLLEHKDFINNKKLYPCLIVHALLQLFAFFIFQF